jgi:predicted AlkP superfamily phosphohydrolase/phosphomutase
MESSENNKKPILIIGIDGATFNIINPLIEQGRLPNIARLMCCGVYGPLKSSVPALSPVAWTSFMTGMNPGTHGIFDFSGRVPNSYRFKINNATDIRTKPLWMILSELQKKVCVIGVTMTFPPENVNGYMVSGLGTPPDLNCTFTHPSDLNKEIEEEFGKFIVVPKVNLRVIKKSRKEKARYIKKVFESAEQRTKIFKYLWNKESFDFGMLFFLDTDGVSHYFWKYMDSSHKGYDRQSARKFGDTIFKVYEKIDNSIGEILHGVKKDCHIIIVSDHGFGPLERVLFLNNWLKERGHLRFKNSYGINRLRSTLSKIKGKQTSLPNLLEKVDWKNTKAFFNGTVGNIFINLKGREPEGLVEPGEEYERLCRQLTEELYELADPENGESVVNKVYQKEEIINDWYNECAPDLTIILKPRYGVVGQEIFLHGLKDRGEIISDSNNWSGDHESDGILIAHGPSLKKSERISGARIIDIVPTILYLMGLPVPRNLDGNVLIKAFKDDFLKSNRIVFSSDSATKESASIEYTESEAELVKDRLKDLGYLE